MKKKHISVFFDRESFEFVGLDPIQLKRLKETYPNIDVDHELRKMKMWLMTDKGKLRKGNLEFILSWLGRATPKKKPVETDLMKYESKLEPHIFYYLRGLWKDREYLLELNSTTS